MTVKQFKQTKRVAMILLIALNIFSIMLDKLLILLLSVGGFAVLISLLKTRVDGPVNDEREIASSDKASRISFQILMPILMLSSFILIFSSGNEEFYYNRALGVILSYVTCLGLIIYVLSYIYFDKKTGGG